MKKLVRWYIGLSVAGFLNSVWLLILHLQGKKLSSICTVSETISCAVLQYRSYSHWFDIPVPVYSILFYIFLIVVGMAALRNSDKHAVRPYLYLWLLSWAGLLTIGYFAYVSAFVLHMLCPFCAVLYVVNTGLWLVASKIMKALNQPWGYLVSADFRRIYKSPWILVPLGVSVLVLIGARTVLHSTGVLVGAEVKIVGDDARTMGPSEASTTIAVFSDFQCPHCKIGAEVLHQLEEEMRGKVRVTYKFYPLDPACNSQIQGHGHPFACKAAQAAYCASSQNQFWPYHDILFENQMRLSAGSFDEFARALQTIDLTQFDACMHDDRVVDEIKTDIAEGTQLNVQGTPTIFINGKRYEGPLTVSSLEEAASLTSQR